MKRIGIVLSKFFLVFTLMSNQVEAGFFKDTVWTLSKGAAGLFALSQAHDLTTKGFDGDALRISFAAGTFFVGSYLMQSGLKDICDKLKPGRVAVNSLGAVGCFLCSCIYSVGSLYEILEQQEPLCAARYTAIALGSFFTGCELLKCFKKNSPQHYKAN